MSFILDAGFSKEKDNPEKWMEKEWLVTNGLGGYCSNSVNCIPTRKYHGFLVSSLPETGRTIMLNHILEIVTLEDGREFFLNPVEHSDGILDLKGASYLESFILENGSPIWRYNFEGTIFEKRIFMTHNQNSAHIIYNLIDNEKKIELKLVPYLNFRPISENVSLSDELPYVLLIQENKYEIHHDNFPNLKLYLKGDALFILDRHLLNYVFYRKEARMGYPALGSFWSPGYFKMSFGKEQNSGALTASTENWDELLSMDAFEALQAESFRKVLLLKKAVQVPKNQLGKQLIFAADDFIITPASRVHDKVRANALGDEVRTVIAGYHWFGDWGRDTMISLEGLTLCCGRQEEARWILRTFAYYVKNGLIPNMFPEGYNEGLYHTADASLWFFHALKRYYDRTQDHETLKFILPKLLEIYHAHKKGTLFGIRADEKDGLLIQGEEGYQLTWMDAKVEDWVVTPRRGKAVEINALWYNALRCLENWLKDESQNKDIVNEIHMLANQVQKSFNEKFWNKEKKYLFDVIEGEKGDDNALRPNQLFAISLDYPVLNQSMWQPVFDIVKNALLTPIGLRSLAIDHVDFKKTYSGDLRARDAAYHQGTVWSWLIGPYIDVWLKIEPDAKTEVKVYLDNFVEHFKDAGIGYISEIFDALEPHHPRGCIAQAWSIAEILRCLIRIND